MPSVFAFLRHDPPPLRHWGGVLGLVLLLSAVLVPWGQAQPTPSDSLSLVERYRTTRFRMLVQQYLAGRAGIPGQPPRPLPVEPDSLLGTRRARASGASSARPSFPVTDVRRVRDLESGWFQTRYEDVEWSFLGAGTRLTFYDTTRTRDLRARLQAQFGDPTHTMAEVYSREWLRAPDSARADPVQFEYWFVVNDSIPVRVSDINGPVERGVIVSTDRAHREQLPALRAALFAPLRRGDRAPYVDYYYEEETRRWYRVGHDGTQFFRERISRFDITPGRRPHLDTTQVEPPSAREASSSAS